MLSDDIRITVKYHEPCRAEGLLAMLEGRESGRIRGTAIERANEFTVS